MKSWRQSRTETPQTNDAMLAINRLTGLRAGHPRKWRIVAHGKRKVDGLWDYWLLACAGRVNTCFNVVRGGEPENKSHKFKTSNHALAFSTKRRDLPSLPCPIARTIHRHQSWRLTGVPQFFPGALIKPLEV